MSLASPESASSGAATVVNAGRRAGALVLMGLSIVGLLAMLGYERWSNEAMQRTIVNHITTEDHRKYAEAVDRRMRERDAEVERRLRVVEDASTRTAEAVEGIRRDAARHEEKIDRLLERIPPR